MVFFTIKGKNKEYPYIVLNGKNFYLRVQELVFGRNKFTTFATSKEELKDLKIEVIDIDIEPDNINSTVGLYFSNNNINNFQPIYYNTIKNNYKNLDLEQSFDFYRNICYTYSEEKIEKIIFLVIYKNVSKKWISIYFNIEMNEVNFLLDYLAVYYNYIEFREELWHTL